MAKIIIKKPIMVQMYDKTSVKEYYKIFKGFFFSSQETVFVDRLKNELILEIDSQRVPDKIIFNGSEVLLEPINKK